MKSHFTHAIILAFAASLAAGCTTDSSDNTKNEETQNSDKGENENNGNENNGNNENENNGNNGNNGNNENENNGNNENENNGNNENENNENNNDKKPDISEYSCENVQCADGEACFSGKCLEVASEGASCSASMFVERCTSSSKLQYCDKGFVSEFSCVGSEKCVFGPDIDGKGTKRADCLDDSYKCKAGDPDRHKCYRAKSDKKHYVSTTKCTVSDKGEYYYQQTGDEFCPGGCNEDNTACAKAQSCTVSRYSASCSGDTLTYCTSDSIVGTLNCTDIDANATCQVIANRLGDGVDFGSCFTDRSACEKENDTKTTCSEKENGKKTVTTYKCMKATSGRLFWTKINAEDCKSDYACNETLTACAPKKTCSSDSYNETCSGTIASYCLDGIITYYSCDSYTAISGTPHSCQLFDHKNRKYAQCVSEKDQCTTAGKSETTCKDTNQGAYLASTYCSKSNIDGKNYKIIPEDPTECGENQVCDETFSTCKTAQSCTADTKPGCSKDSFTYCDPKKNILINRNCKDLGPKFTCVDDEKSAGCHESCSIPGAKRTVCLDPTGFGTFGVISYLCTQTADGSYWIATDDNVRTCKNGCNQEATDCL